MRKNSFSFLLLLVGACAIGACDDDTSTTSSSGSTSSGSGSSTSSGTSTSSSTGAGGADCTAPLPEDTVQALSLGIEPSYGAHPGDTIDFGVGTVACCYTFTEVDACAVYSSEPAAGATIDPVTGVFVIDPSTPAGSVFTVTADVENGRRLVTTKVYVYTPQSNPLVGAWSEESELACGTNAPIAPESPIGELVFRADGTFGVTWMPFELYVDYWGTYAFDLGTNALTLTVDSGNYVPKDIDGTGTFTVSGGKLTLGQMWLGTSQGGMGAPACGHVFH
ncbi:MAG: hypothetical protein U0414_41545 [Polyangiaceae bacterium]